MSANNPKSTGQNQTGENHVNSATLTGGAVPSSNSLGAAARALAISSVSFANQLVQQNSELREIAADLVKLEESDAAEERPSVCSTSPR